MKLSVHQLATLLEHHGCAVLDVRSPDEFADEGHLPGAINIPLQSLGAQLSDVAIDGSIACMCASGIRSLAATRLLRLAGVTEVYTVDGGYAAWHEAGLPLVYDVIPV
jgi:rhodanese-related sulfurtransferase